MFLIRYYNSWKHYLHQSRYFLVISILGFTFSCHNVSQVTSSFEVNLLKGAGMDAASEAEWTVEDPNDKEPFPNYIFGSTASLPKNAIGTGLFITDNNPFNIEGKGENIFLYQSIFLTAGTYKFSADIKVSEGGKLINGLIVPAGAPYHYWFEFFLSKDKPLLNEHFSNTHAKDLLAAFTSWDHGTPPAADGNVMRFDNKKNVKANDDGFFNITLTTTYYFTIQFGKSPIAPGEFGSGSFGINGIGLDNLKLVKIKK